LAQSDKVEALRVSFITDKIRLTPAEGQSFWPLYNEYNDKVKALRKSFRQQYGAVSEFKSDKEAEDFLNAELKLRQNEVELQKDYTEKFKKVLGAKKTAQLRKAEEEFKREIIKTIKGNGNDS
ncbi:MAG: hypothetical protein ACXVPQ_03765, partial [Bacteroidia bacterium]